MCRLEQGSFPYALRCAALFFHSQEARLQGLVFFEFLFLIGSNYKGPQGGPGGGGGGQQPGENLGEAGSLPVPTTPTCHPHPYRWKCKWRKVPDPLNNPKKP